MDGRESEVTRLLVAWSDGDSSALEQLMPLVSHDLRRIAQRYMGRERHDHTLQPTALVNEFYLRLIDRRRVSWRNRAQFFGFAARMMRHILVDHARNHHAEKRGQGEKPLPLNEAAYLTDQKARELIALDDALNDLAKIDRRQSQVVELHFFAGLNYSEIGEVLNISQTTVKRCWRAAKLWLYEHLKSSSGTANCDRQRSKTIGS